MHILALIASQEYRNTTSTPPANTAQAERWTGVPVSNRDVKMTLLDMERCCAINT